MKEFIIFETENWYVSHRSDSRYEGYLIVSSKEEVSNISELKKKSLSEMGKVLSMVEKLLIEQYNPCKVIMAKLGFSKGFSCHFHVIPVQKRLLDEIIEHSSYTNEPDGNDVMLFISRQYCEKPLDKKQINQIVTTVKRLKTQSGGFLPENEDE